MVNAEYDFLFLSIDVRRIEHRCLKLCAVRNE